MISFQVEDVQAGALVRRGDAGAGHVPSDRAPLLDAAQRLVVAALAVADAAMAGGVGGGSQPIQEEEEGGEEEDEGRGYT